MNTMYKTIRFIDSEYRELFTIPDGESIRITYPPADGRVPVAAACKYIDEAHTQIGNNSYHICEFAENMERIGAQYEPVAQLKFADITPFEPGEEKYFTYNREKGNSCVGHTSGNFGQQGDRFHSVWSVRANGKNTAKFQTDLYSAMYALRRHLLKDHASMVEYCKAHPEAKLPDRGGLEHYGFSLDTKTRRYFINCMAEQYSRDSRFIVYAYNKPVEREQKRSVAGELLPGAAEERKMFYQNDAAANASVGYLRGDFGKSGDEFWHNWFDGAARKNTQKFKSEFQDVVNLLRQDILKDHSALAAYCRTHPDAKLPDGGGAYFGFKLETESRQYFVRCTPLQNNYFYIHVYDKAALRKLEQSIDEKPSVLKQIRDSEKAPKPPRKEKAPGKHDVDL